MTPLLGMLGPAAPRELFEYLAPGTTPEALPPGRIGTPVNLLTRELLRRGQRVVLFTLDPTLEQEVVLNTPGKKDGAIRIWADGALVVDRKNMLLRDKDTVTFAGVQADVHYGGADIGFQSPKDTKILLTPFEVRTR